ncbi:hypothetical protein J4446_00290 [Candidatus Woesearchaeota archaeon]|nr:hypothetical protein [Candidatus Woesearchaeota archaeon]
MDIAKESVYWIFRIIIIGLALLFVILILGSMMDYEVDSNDLESYVIRNKIILDKDCLAYEGYRTELGIIDANKFNKNNIASCLNTKKGIALNLTYDGYSETILINEDLADKIDFCFDEETFSCIRKGYNLILNDNLQEIPARLIIDTIALK